MYLLQFAMLESSSVDDDLASLKKEISGSTKVVGTFYSLLLHSISKHVHQSQLMDIAIATIPVLENS